MHACNDATKLHACKWCRTITGHQPIQHRILAMNLVEYYHQLLHSHNCKPWENMLCKGLRIQAHKCQNWNRTDIFIKRFSPLPHWWWDYESSLISNSHTWKPSINGIMCVREYIYIVKRMRKKQLNGKNRYQFQVATIKTDIPSLYNFSCTCKERNPFLSTEEKKENILVKPSWNGKTVPRRNLRGALPIFESKICPLSFNLPV